MSDFILRRWYVSVSGYSDQVYLASTRGKALAEAWRAYSSVYDVEFGDFLRVARCRLDRSPPDWFGAPIMVGGLPGFYCGHAGQYVEFARDGGEHTLLSHPLDVTPEQYRPRAYRSLDAVA